MRWLLRYALMLRAILRNAGVEKRAAETLGIGIAVRFEIGALDGTCTHTLPADNGLLFYSATRAKWFTKPKLGERRLVGSAGNAPVVASGFILRHPIYSRVAGTLPID